MKTTALLIFLLAASLRAADFDVKDASEFSKCIDTTSAKVEKLAGGMKFLEGPVWVPDNGGYLVFSDIPADELKKWTKADGVTTFRKPSDMTNGNALAPDGQLISACHLKRSVLATDKNKEVSTLVDAYEGKKLNSPNDVVVKSDGTIWFTDPPYGLPKGMQPELDFRGVYRFDPATKKLTVVVKDMPWPNGLAFSPDEKTLYVAMSDKDNPVIRAFEVKADGTIGAGRDLCKIDKGIPDGFRVDAEGRIWTSAGDGVQIFSKDGKLLGKILVPESPANLCFGGPDGHTLSITARTSLYAIEVKTTGAAKR